jgi:hypothetical protein
MTETEYGSDCAGRTAVRFGHDFIHNGYRYQVKANRPSGRRGSPVTLVSKAKNYQWDKLIWILYDRKYRILEAWEWKKDDYRKRFHQVKYVRPDEMRQRPGRKLVVSSSRSSIIS